MTIGSLKSLYNLIGSCCPSKGLSPRFSTLMSNSIVTRPQRREEILKAKLSMTRLNVKSCLYYEVAHNVLTNVPPR